MKPYQANKKRFAKKHVLLISLFTMLALGLVAGTLALKGRDSSHPETSSAGGINYGPPTEEEKTAGDERKKEILKEEQNTDPKPSVQTKTATVIVTDAGQYDDTIEVRAFIPDHYQDGTCTITFRQGNHDITKESPAYRDASTTICTNPMIQRSEFPAGGDWQVSVAYTSADAKGQSETKTIKIN